MKSHVAAILAGGIFLASTSLASVSAYAQQPAPSEQEQQLALAFQCYGITKVLSQTKSQTLSDVGLTSIAWKKFKPQNAFWLSVLQNITQAPKSKLDGEVADLVQQVDQGITILPRLAPDQADNFRSQIQDMAKLCGNIQARTEPPKPQVPQLNLAEKEATKLCVVAARKQSAMLRRDIEENSMMAQLTGKEALENQIKFHDAEADIMERLLSVQTPSLRPPFANAEAKLSLEDQLISQSAEQAFLISSLEQEEYQAAKRENRARNANVADDARKRSDEITAQMQTLKAQRETDCENIKVKFLGAPPAAQANAQRPVAQNTAQNNTPSIPASRDIIPVSSAASAEVTVQNASPQPVETSILQAAGVTRSEASQPTMPAIETPAPVAETAETLEQEPALKSNQPMTADDLNAQALRALKQ